MTVRILAPTFNKCGIYFLERGKVTTEFYLILINLSYTESQKYKLCNIAPFKFTVYSLYCLYKPAENLKSYGQTHN